MANEFKTDIGLKIWMEDGKCFLKPSADDKEFIVAFEAGGCTLDELFFIVRYTKEAIIFTREEGNLHAQHIDIEDEHDPALIDLLENQIWRKVVAVMFISKEVGSDRMLQRCWVADEPTCEHGHIWIEQDKSERDDWSWKTGQIKESVELIGRW